MRTRLGGPPSYNAFKSLVFNKLWNSDSTFLHEYFYHFKPLKMTQYFQMNTWYQLIATVLPWLILSGHLCHPALGNKEISSVKCFEVERKALLQFKDGITLDQGGLLDSWRVDSDCCQWYGVHCSNYTGHVTMLRLQVSGFSNRYIEGKVSPSLCELKHLRHLDLGFNIFTPPIPSFLGSLTNLEYLNLTHAFEFDMNISSGNDSYSSHRQNLNWLLHLRLLRYLDLSGNSLSDTKNWIQIISKLPFLGVLRMDGCQLSVNIPSSFAHTNTSSNLRVVSLSGNELFNSSIFQWLFNLPGITTQLVYLDLSWNELKGPIPNYLGNLRHLSHLDLSNNQLEGPVPNDFSKLHHLSYLDLSYNQLKGSVPNEFGNLHHLSHLDLSNNNLEGHIPIEFQHMDSLSYLSLSNNNLQGSFKIFSRLCNFQQLDFSANNFTDEITNVIQALSSCENVTLLKLDLSRNHFWGAIPDSISSLTMLTELYLSGNQLIGKISKDIRQLTMLEKLDISSNSLEDTLTHAHFLNLSRLRELYLSDNPRLVIDIDASWVLPFQLDIISLRFCKLGLSFPKWLYMQTNFSYLDVSNAEISGTIHVSFWKSLSFKLQYLNMSYNQFSGLIPFLPNLDYSPDVVDLSSNLFEGAIPSGFTRASTLYLNGNRFSDSSYILCPKTITSLSEVDLSNNLLSGKLPDCWMNLESLSSLHLENNRFYGSIPKSIGTLNYLQYLHLHNNSFSGPIPASLENCASLAILNLGYNSFTGNIPPWIGNVQRLGAVILRKNNFIGEIPASLCQLSNLQILDVAMNHISGVIPRCISNVTAMTTNTSYGLFFAQASNNLGRVDITNGYETAIVTWKREEQNFKYSLRYVKSIDFSFNELSGEIPDGIYNLTGLVSLDLSNNNMSGSISAEIGQLTALELLDLSGNHLSGTIPDSLAQLSSLAILGLSNNNLSGKIPIGTQLQSFDANSYTGNPGLCGAPLLKCPGDQAELNAPNGNNSSTVQEKHEDYDLFLLGLYISVVLGFIIGFWGVCGTLVIKRSWRHAWFQLIQDAHDRFYEIALGIIPQAWKKPRR
ncbi:receptor-like protein EIX1 [Silene latifolia]|uniref:receptor-like protein EIX1 n=1 Tax=Silene latifolia TaxID=37657 RepID=UPI003D77CFFA